MKKLFSLFLILTSTNSFSINKLMVNIPFSFDTIPVIDWIHFDPVKTSSFSESFKKLMSEQLYPQLYTLLGDEVSKDEFSFMLYIGSSDIKMEVRDNYVFMIARLSTDFASSYEVSIAWKSVDFKNPSIIHKSNIDGKNVEFSWCDDLPKEKILQELKPSKIINKTDSGFHFDVLFYLQTFPDVCIYFDFNSAPSDTTLTELNQEVKNYRNKYKTIFAHDLFRYKKDYLICINYNTIDYSNYSETDYKKDIDNLNELLISINRNQNIKDLRRLRFK